jgi:hypothetical protein
MDNHVISTKEVSACVSACHSHATSSVLPGESLCSRGVQTCMPSSVAVSAFSNHSVQANPVDILISAGIGKIIQPRNKWICERKDGHPESVMSMVVSVIKSFSARKRIVGMRVSKLNEIESQREAEIRERDLNERKLIFERNRRTSPLTFLDRRIVWEELDAWYKDKLQELSLKRSSATISKNEIVESHCRIWMERARRKVAAKPKRSRSMEYRPKLVMMNGKMIEIFDEEKATLIKLFNDMHNIDSHMNRESRKSSLLHLHEVLQNKDGWEELDQLILRELHLMDRPRAGKLSGLRLRISNTALSLLTATYA